MESKEFTVFGCLLTEVYLKAFGESISTLPHGKAQTLSWLIYESTGEMLSYKTLANYVSAVLAEKPGSINPSDSTLSILATYVMDVNEQCMNRDLPTRVYAAWYKYRSNLLTRAVAA